MLIRMPMIPRTMTSSMRVKPRSPVLVEGPVEGLGRTLGVNIVDILLAPDVRIEIVLVGPKAPVIRVGRGVLGDAAEALDGLPGPRLALGVLLLDLDALDQGLQRRRVALGVLVDLELLLVGHLFVRVDRVPQGPQGSLK